MVYLIMSGQYSGWQVHGYFTKPEEAYSYCANMNMSADGSEWSDEYYVFPAGKIDAGITAKTTFYYRYTVYCVCPQGGKSWDIRLNEEEITAVKSLDRSHVTWENRGNYGRSVRIQVYLNQYDVDRARKIAQDILYQYLWQLEELEAGSGKDKG